MVIVVWGQMLDGLFKSFIKKGIFELKFDKEKYPPKGKTVEAYCRHREQQVIWFRGCPDLTLF